MADFRAIAELLALAIGAIDDVIRIFRDRKGDQADALTVIGALVDAVDKGDLGGIDPDRAKAELLTLISALRENDQAADQAVDDKFEP